MHTSATGAQRRVSPRAEASNLRSRWMSSIKTTDTYAERVVEGILGDLAISFAANVRELPGSPDFELTGHMVVVQVHGCFWHRHRGCPRASLPKTNTAFWRKKLFGNARRDRFVARMLKDLGYSVVTIWSCELSELKVIERRILAAITRRAAVASDTGRYRLKILKN